MSENKMMGDELQIGNSFRLYTVMQQRDYRKLKEAADLPWKPDEARMFLAKVFGFELKKIEVAPLVAMYEYKGCGTWRMSEISVQRDPIYISSDWNYVRFRVCGVCWEVVNGHIYTVAE